MHRNLFPLFLLLFGALNRAVALAMVHGPTAGLTALDAVAAGGRLAGHHRLDAVRAHLLERAGDLAAARRHYLRAAEGTASLAERHYLLARAARIASGSCADPVAGLGAPRGRADDPALPMRHAALLLLILVLPGLLLPAGFLLRICRCEPVPTVAACCAAHAEPAEHAGCCRHAQRPPAFPDDGLPRTHADGCGCIWLTLPAERPDPAPPGSDPLLAPAPAPLRIEPLPAPPTVVRTVVPRSQHVRPPPDHQRSLPLRL